MSEADLHDASLRAIVAIHERAAYLRELANEVRDTNGKMFAMLNHAASELCGMTRAVDMAILGLPVRTDAPLRSLAHSSPVTGL